MTLETEAYIQHRVIISNSTFKDTVILVSAKCEGDHCKQNLTFNFQLQGEIGEPGQKGSKGDKGENVSSKILCPFCFFINKRYSYSFDTSVNRNKDTF